MLATAEDIPEELFERILDFAVGDVGMSKRELGMCALTCTYWADKVQPRIFDRIILRCSEDVYTLASFFESDYSRVAEYLDFLVLEQQGPSKPWIHLVALLITSKLRLSPITVSLDKPHSTKDKWPFRSIHGALPRSNPSFSCHIGELTLTDIHFRKFADFLSLIAEVPQLRVLTCRRLTWPDLSAGLPAPARHVRSLHSVVVDECKDSRSLIWLFIGPNRLIPRVASNTGELNMNADDSLVMDSLIGLFAEPLIGLQLMFHRSNDKYSLVYSELNDEDSTNSNSCHLPDITFSISEPPRDTLNPFALVQPANDITTHYVTSVEVDFHTFDQDWYCSCDWAVFDDITATLTRLGKIVIGFHSEDELRRFYSTEPFPMVKSLQASKLRCGYWNAERGEWVKWKADASEPLEVSQYLENI